MASDVTEVDVRPAAPLEAPPQRQRPVRPHQARFLLIYGGLVAILAAAAVGVVVYAGKGSQSAPPWSAWKPTGGGVGAAEQIANHVAGRYRLANGDQLVDVLPRAPSVTDGKTTIPVQIVAVQGTQGKIGEVTVVKPSDSLMYLLCGLGRSCTIATGKPSVERGTLVRREILELALYTFKYVPGMERVIAFMPPPAVSKPAVVIYLRKSDVQPLLDEPLGNTLASKVPTVATIPMRTREVRAIDSMVTPRAFNIVTVTQTQQGDSALVLRPLPAS